MTDEELSQLTLDLLEKELGMPGMGRFLRLARAGAGDYARDRHTWLDGVTIDEIVREPEERYPNAPVDREASWLRPSFLRVPKDFKRRIKVRNQVWSMRHLRGMMRILQA